MRARKVLTGWLLVTVSFFSLGWRNSDVREVLDQLPSGYQAVEGSSSYSVNGNTATLVASDAVTIGEWSGGFIIGSRNTLNVDLPSGGAHLSRDISANPSQIFGALNVPQGRFFLVNSNGVYFSSGARVNAAGLVASTLDISNTDFINGQYQFFQNGSKASSVENYGNIAGNDLGVVLLGGAVLNDGTITTDASDIHLANAREAILDLNNTGTIGIAVPLEANTAVNLQRNTSARQTKLTDGVLNTGTIKAAAGKVALTGSGSVFDYIVNQRGIVEAKTTPAGAGSVEINGLGAGKVGLGTQGRSRRNALMVSENVQVNADQVILDDLTVQSDTATPSQFTVNALSDITSLYEIDVHGDVAMNALGDVYLEKVSANSVTVNALGNITGRYMVGCSGGQINNVLADSFTAVSAGSITNLFTQVNSMDVVSGGSLAISNQSNLLTVSQALSDLGDLNLKNSGSMSVLSAITNSNSLSLTAGGNLGVDTVVGSSTGVVNLNASGAVLDLNGQGTTNVVSDTLNVNSRTGVNLDTEVNTVNATNQSSGSIIIREADDLTANLVNKNGHISAQAAGNLNARNINAGGRGNISLRSDGGNLSLGTVLAHSDIAELNSAGAILDTNAGLINIDAKTVILTAGSNIGTAVDKIEVRAASLNASSGTNEVNVAKVR